MTCRISRLRRASRPWTTTWHTWSMRSQSGARTTWASAATLASNHSIPVPRAWTSSPARSRRGARQGCRRRRKIGRPTSLVSTPPAGSKSSRIGCCSGATRRVQPKRSWARTSPGCWRRSGPLRQRDAAQTSGGRARQGIEQHAGELRSDAGFLVLEVYEHVAASGSPGADGVRPARSEEHTSELQSRSDLVCRLLLEKKKKEKI